jgi:hypothetical protein
LSALPRFEKHLRNRHEERGVINDRAASLPVRSD